jgi:hypothetical protein
MHGSFILVSHHLFLTLYFLACEFHSCFIEVGFLVHCFICSPATFCFRMCLQEVLGVFSVLLFSGCCQSRLVFFFAVCCTEPGIFAHLSFSMIHTVLHYPAILAMCITSFALFIFDPKFHVCLHVCF